jgi:hypothetical protein
MTVWKFAFVVVLGLCCATELQGGLFPYKYKTVQVTVVDDESGEPIQDVGVDVSYSDEHYLFQPKPDSASTDDAGKASIIIAIGTSDWEFSLHSKKYYESKTQFEDLHQTSYTIKLKKIPKITLIVPNGYVGAIHFNQASSFVRKQLKGEYQEYILRANATGNINIENLNDWKSLGQPLERSILIARYENGQPIPLEDTKNIQDSTNALRYAGKWLQNLKNIDRIPCFDETNTPQIVYVIGTVNDQKAWRDSHKDWERLGFDFDFDIRDTNWKEPEDTSIDPKRT